MNGSADPAFGVSGSFPFRRPFVLGPLSFVASSFVLSRRTCPSLHTSSDQPKEWEKGERAKQGRRSVAYGIRAEDSPYAAYCLRYARFRFSPMVWSSAPTAASYFACASVSDTKAGILAKGRQSLIGMTFLLPFCFLTHSGFVFTATRLSPTPPLCCQMPGHLRWP